MHGDFSRWTFDASSGDRGVLTFQGRVVLDQDLNKQWAISDYLRQRRTVHIVGPCGAPEDEAGFAIAPLGPGLGAGPGALYTHGVLCENAAVVSLEAQPHLPVGAPIVRLANGTDVTLADAPDGQYFAVLDRWTRLVTPLQRPGLLETALAGADTSGVARTIWQVRLVRAGGLNASVHCGSEPQAWLDLIAGSNGTFRARAQPSLNAGGPCVVEAGAGYRRVGNHTYRVEIHRPGPVGTATFKWSRENGSVATRWLASSGTNLTVESIGRDRVRGFGPGDWVELIDDDRALQGLPGTMVRLLNAQDNLLIIDAGTADGPVDIASFATNPIVRRWDGSGVQTVTVPGGNQGYLALEDGVEIGFEAGTTYATGDYVMIPARYEINDIEWPRDPNTNEPLRLPAQGIQHAYCKLALLQKAGGWSFITDCRELFPPLTGLVSMDMLGGDGQEAAPDPTDPTVHVALDQPLRVGVSRGSTPLPGRRVRFTVVEGNGQLTGGANSVVAITDAAGVASVDWRIDGTTRSQRVEAELLDPGGDRRHLPISFSATLSRAVETSFDPANCPPLAGAHDVQAAIELLCQIQRGGCATYIATPDMDWVGLLEGLQPDEDAHICFQRGRYTAARAVELRGYGHIRISGCGAGSEIVVSRSERAIEAIDCDSFSLNDISVATPDGGSAVGHVRHLGGTVTATGCADVSIADTLLSCGAGVNRERTCLTIRPAGFNQSARPTPLRSARVTGNRLAAGYGQLGMLITDAARVHIRDNELVVRPRPRGLTLDRLLANPARRASLVSELVAQPYLETQSLTAGTRTLRAGAFTAHIPSSMPQSEWQALMDANPPTEAQTSNAEAFQGYVTRLVDGVTAEPSRLPSYEMQLRSLEEGIGRPAFRRLDSQVLSGLLLRAPVSVRRFDEGNPQRNTILVQDNHRVTFDSPISDRDWQSIARAAAPGDLRTDRDLMIYARNMADRIIRDATFRSRFATAATWFTALAQNVQPTAYQGIVIGGRTLGSADISGNRIEGYGVGLQIGLSHADPTRQTFDTAGAVSIRDNEILLRRPVEQSAGAFGAFIGNADRVRFDGNQIRWASGRDDRAHYYEGVRFYGRFGNFVMFKDNLVDLTSSTVALRMRHTGPTRQASQVQWLAADNWSLSDFDYPSFNVPSAMVLRNNKQ